MALLVTSFPLEETQSVLEGQGRRRPSRFSPIGYGAGRSAAASVNQGICCAELGWTIACSEWSIGGVESGGETRRESARAVVTGADSMSSISTVSLYKNLGGRRERIAATPVQRYSMLGCGGAGWVLLLGCAALGVHPVAAEHAAGSSGIMVSGRRAEAVPPGTLPLRAVLRGGSGGLWGNTLQGGSTSLGTSGTFNSGSWSAGDKKAYNPGNDPEVEHCPSDGVTQLAFSPKVLVPKQYLVSSSWDGQLRCWEVEASSGKTSPVGMQRHEKPLMCCTWTADGSGILAGGADGKGMYWRIETGAWTQFASHDAAIVGVFHAEYPSPSGAGCYITGSWDRTVKFWDPRSSSGQPIGVLQVPERVYAMDVVGRVMVIATAERHVLVYDLRNPAQVSTSRPSPPGTNRTHISPPPGTNRTHIFPPRRTDWTHISPPHSRSARSTRRSSTRRAASRSSRTRPGSASGASRAASVRCPAARPSPLP